MHLSVSPDCFVPIQTAMLVATYVGGSEPWTYELIQTKEDRKQLYP